MAGIRTVTVPILCLLSPVTVEYGSRRSGLAQTR